MAETGFLRRVAGLTLVGEELHHGGGGGDRSRDTAPPPHRKYRYTWSIVQDFLFCLMSDFAMGVFLISLVSPLAFLTVGLFLSQLLLVY